MRVGDIRWEEDESIVTGSTNRQVVPRGNRQRSYRCIRKEGEGGMDVRHLFVRMPINPSISINPP